MLSKSWFDRWFEQSARGVAARASRRSFLAKLGVALVGSSALPLLPVERHGRASAATPAAGAKHAWDDPTQCEYWTYCAIDGWLCSSCGGTSSKCPPGTEPSPISWVGTCKHPGDGKSYVVAYNDCCGKSQCMGTVCERSEGDTPRYRPQRANSITWCYGGVSSTYHCTVSRLQGPAES
ncbi:MAG TPA: methylamine dehydrogenase light chain [Steroidobacteraceae bacterium]|jgi:methylamine dehydrogenase light chain|nr:methylamine dehydrogenase light chain [Steroidobacteraceae bacterium]